MMGMSLEDQRANPCIVNHESAMLVEVHTNDDTFSEAVSEKSITVGSPLPKTSANA